MLQKCGQTDFHFLFTLLFTHFLECVQVWTKCDQWYKMVEFSLAITNFERAAAPTGQCGNESEPSQLANNQSENRKMGEPYFFIGSQYVQSICMYAWQNSGVGTSYQLQGYQLLISLHSRKMNGKIEYSKNMGRGLWTPGFRPLSICLAFRKVVFFVLILYCTPSHM